MTRFDRSGDMKYSVSISGTIRKVKLAQAVLICKEV